MPEVARPDPARTRRASSWPWYPPSNLRIMSRPVAALASRIADIEASVPEFTKRIISMDGTASTMSLAAVTSISVGAPNDAPRAVASCAAWTTSGCA